MNSQSSIDRRIEKLPGHCVYNTVSSPIGSLAVFVSDRGVHEIFWPEALDAPESEERFSKFAKTSEHPVYLRAARELREYFAGTRASFDVPVVLNGTPFQNSAWKLLQTIPYGKTLSYEEQAIRLGGKEKVRAVGRANGMNPIPILIPCHRVIGKNGSLTGFGGGLAIKAFLLELESRFSMPIPC